jgi:hypothetical protein
MRVLTFESKFYVASEAGSDFDIGFYRLSEPELEACHDIERAIRAPEEHEIDELILKIFVHVGDSSRAGR